MNSPKNSSSDESFIGGVLASVAPESAQSQVLRNPDLLEFVFVFFHPRSPQSESEDLTGRIPFPDSQHLLWASLASKNFLESALNVLWRSLDSWFPLLHLIPVLDSDGRGTTSNGIIEEEHIETMARYAKRVRHIRVESSKGAVMPPFIYACIGQILADQSTTLIPHLRTLSIPDIGDISSDDIQGLFLILCSTMTEAIISGVGDQSSEVLTASLLRRISQRSRTIKHLTLKGWITATSLTLLNRFQSLRTLRLDMQSTPFSREILHELSQIPTLQRLSLLLDSSCTFFTSASPTISNFQSLHQLEISASAQIALMVFIYITTPRLSVLSLHFSSVGEDTGSQGKCLQRITDVARSLSFIQITSYDFNTYISGADLTCLHLCPSLEHIDIPVDYLTVGVLRHIFGHCWLSVKYLKLVSRKKRPSLKSESQQLGLSHLTKITPICPKLETLHISIVLDVSRLDYGDNTSNGHSLKELVLLPFADSTPVLDDIATATPSNAYFVARFIDHAFPYISKCDLSKLTSINDDWRDGVQTMVTEIQRMRNTMNKANKKQDEDNELNNPVI